MIFDQFMLDENDYKIIPINWGGVEYFTFTFEGFKNISFHSDDAVFLNAINLCKSTLNFFIFIYKNTHAFTQPLFSVKIDEIIFTLKIGIMKIEKYKERMKNYNYD